MCPGTARNRIKTTDGLVGSQHDWICDGKSLSAACYCGVGHERHEIEWVYKFLVETQESPPIEYSANPVDNQHVMVRITKIWMIGHPDIKPMFQSDIDRDKLRAECKSIIWQHANTGSPFHRVKYSGACICSYANDAFDAFDAQ